MYRGGGGFAKPENALKRAEELEKVGREELVEGPEEEVEVGREEGTAPSPTLPRCARTSATSTSGSSGS